MIQAQDAEGYNTIKEIDKMGKQSSDKYWITCPVCGGKTRVKVREDTILLKFPLFCPKCKKETIIDVVKLKMVVAACEGK